MKLDDQINDIVNEFAQGVIDGIKNNIETKNPTGFGAMDNTGEAKNSLSYRFDGSRLEIVSNINGEFNYIMTLETGRRAGKMPPPQTIEAWLQQRGINPPDISQKSLAFLIARKIGREGSALYRAGGNSGIISDFTNPKYIETHLFDQIVRAIRDSLTNEIIAA